MTTKKWLDLGLFAIALFLFFALRSGLAFIWETFSISPWAALADFPFSLTDLIAFAVILGALIWVRRIPVVDSFGQEVVLELTKVTWPERKETVMSTGVVLVMITIASFLLFLMDSLWGTLTKGILEF